MSFYPNWYKSYGPWFTPKCCFRSIFWEQIELFSPNFIFAFILRISSLGLLQVIFPTLALDLRPNFVSAQYLENQLIEFHQILYMHSYWQDLAWHCYKTFSPHLYQSYGPWITPKLCLRSISWEQVVIFSPNFIYRLILTRSSVGLLHVIFPKFVPVIALIYAKISFPLNILITNW